MANGSLQGNFSAQRFACLPAMAAELPNQEKNKEHQKKRRRYAKVSYSKCD
jgi:hypothetical protein